MLHDDFEWESNVPVNESSREYNSPCTRVVESPKPQTLLAPEFARVVRKGAAVTLKPQSLNLRLHEADRRFGSRAVEE